MRRLHNNQVLAGFAGAVADALALFDKFEGKLQEYNGSAAARRRRAGEGLANRPRAAPPGGAAGGRRRGDLAAASRAPGDLIEPDDGILAIGSGGNYALAAARALVRTCAATERARRSPRVA